MKNKKTIITIVILLLLLLLLLIAISLNHTYKVSFVSDGEVIATVSIRPYSKLDKTSNPVKEGYTFGGWYLNGKKFDSNTKITNNIILEAKWIDNTVQTSTIPQDTTDNEENQNNKDNENNIDENEVVDNKPNTKPSSTTKPTSTTKPDSSSKPSSTSKPGSSTKPSSTSKPEEKPKPTGTSKPEEKPKPTGTSKPEETTKPEETKKEYTITFDVNGGSQVSTQKVEQGNMVQKPTNPTKQGYTFLGWYLEGQKYNFSNAVTGNITLIAKWEKDEPQETTKPSIPTTRVTYKVEKVEYSSIKQVRIFVLRNKVKVNGSVMITSKSGESKRVNVPSTGLITNSDAYASISSPIAN